MEDITKHRQAIAENIAKAFGEDIEKAHKEGDIHPNGKWYWKSSANGGKGDWRVIRKNKQSGATTSNTSQGKTNAIDTSDKKKVKQRVEDLFMKLTYGEGLTPAEHEEYKKLSKLLQGQNKSSDTSAKKPNTITHDINGTKVTVTKNSDGSYTLEANGKKVKTDDPSFYVLGTNIKPRVKAALAKEVGIDTKKK